ncbi:hypothetical protein M409DRAFT_27982 [Zasmidium cellare ATCC 36951]|uniref:AMP-dependent synthetase/ligase domain-containing protein n=1 Tax=Zasmidium cellare ATCC 36951 TaxID=1080233 RepID=A0A6A6C376_ZASCE|nr:uncharacterized protein M409DRAFT_27982 [Zasmidium cellare ATCC 36951]KAF2161587.1 hypothetical protein M409DRAFT_27982 [Zasmidium cellare ATCC 36951]
MPPRILEPDPEFIEKSYLTVYRRYINKNYGLSLQSYYDLHEWSITKRNDFWMSLWNYLPIKASSQPRRAADESLHIDDIPEFYEGSRLNYAENILSRTGSGIAVKAFNEENLNCPEELSWDQLRERVRVFVDALKSSGIAKGDVICVVGGSTVTSLALVISAAAIGAIVACFTTDAGERVLLERIGQIRPKVLFAVPDYRYNGKLHDITSRIQMVWDTIEPAAGSELVSTGKHTPPGWTSLDKYCSRGTGRPLEFEQVPFHTPYVILFSSGTTGTPKGIVHSQGGLLVNGLKEHRLHYNHDEHAVHYHYAGIGWTLWNIMIGALFCGSQIVLYDGSPFYPSPEKQLAAVMATGVTSFGAGPRYFTELMKANVNPRPYVGKVDKIPSAGALLTEQQSIWIRDNFGAHVCQISTSGGTELCGNFIHGTQTLPVYAGENAVKNLGMDVDVFGPDGRRVPEGESGELVCKKPFPNMPVCFWNDSGRKKYRAAYFEKFPHVWTHGDFMRINPETKGLTILGRKVADAICVGQQREQDPSERLFLFLLLKDGKSLTKELEDRIKSATQRDLSRRHVPQFFFAVEQIPYNVNGKKLEIPLRAVLSEGAKAFEWRKFTAEERQALERYLPYFEVEKIGGGFKAKL